MWWTLLHAQPGRGASRAPRVPERSALSVRVQPPEPSRVWRFREAEVEDPACVNAFVEKENA